MKRFDLSDKEFSLIKDVASYKPARGPVPKQIREMLDGILFVLCTGIPWRCLPEGFPPWRSVYARFRAYQKLGIFEQILATLQKTASARRRIPPTECDRTLHRLAQRMPPDRNTVRKTGVYLCRHALSRLCEKTAQAIVKITNRA